MVQLPAAVCDHIRGRGNSELFGILVSKAIQQLGRSQLDLEVAEERGMSLPTFGIYARWYAAHSDGLEALYFD
jgi:hypothetical protein